MASLPMLLKVSKGYSKAIGQTTFSFGGSTKEESTSKIIQIVGKSHFLCIIEGIGFLLAPGWRPLPSLRSY